MKTGELVAFFIFEKHPLFCKINYLAGGWSFHFYLSSVTHTNKKTAKTKQPYHNQSYFLFFEYNPCFLCSK